MITSGNVLISVLDIAAIASLLWLINLYTKGVDSNKPLWLITGFVILFLIKNAGAYFLHQLQYRFVYSVASRISEMNLLKYLEGDLAGHTEVDSAVWIKKISQQPVEFSHYLLAGVQQAITETVLIILSITAILLFNARVFLLLFLILVPAILLITFFVKQRLRNTRKMIKAGGEQSLRHLKEALSGYVESNLYAKNSFFLKRYTHFQQEVNTHLSELQAIQGAPGRLMEVFAVTGLFILILLHTFYSGTSIDLITIGAFVAAAYKIIPGVVKLVNISSQIKTYAFTLSVTKPFIEKRSAPDTSSYLPIDTIAFSEIDFGYAGKTVLLQQSFIIQKGDLAGISGDSGKGKTTLVNILLGFLQEEKGSICFNGSSIEAGKRKQYWGSIAYVKQQPFLLHDTILTNIILDEDRYDASRLETSLRYSGLDTTLTSLPGGLHKLVTENGRNISGGQRQRIALARAFYKNAALLILDEPFNELDEESSIHILLHLKELAATGKMILLITHDPKSLSFCNKIIPVNERA